LEQGDILTLLGMVAVVVFLAQTLKEGRRRIPQLISLALVIAAVGGYIAYKHREQTRKAQEQAARRGKFVSRIAQFAARHNAVADWQRPISAKSQLGKTYSAELAPLLVRADGRPIFLFASLRNVSETDGRTEVYFDDATSLESQFNLRLDCGPEQAHSLMSDNTAYRFALIAQIRSVDYVLAGDYSLATGRCVDVMPVSVTDYFEFVVEPEVAKSKSTTQGNDRKPIDGVLTLAAIFVAATILLYLSGPHRQMRPTRVFVNRIPNQTRG
jgi:hypothetical protein